MKVKIIGAGSIGNHLSHASRHLGWDVDLCDIDPEALKRTQSAIYPARYQKWDDKIRLYQMADAPKGGYDLIVIGTPPDTHMQLAIDAVYERPRAVLIEKPLCTPSMESAATLHDLAGQFKVSAFTGYDHVIGQAAVKFSEIVASGKLGAVETLDVEFREHWAGIFAAHPWLSGPGDTYLGYWQRGGGASGEHSHAVNLWQHFAHLANAGRVASVGAMLDYVNEGGVNYDRLCSLNLVTERGLMGRVVQDVITRPARKWARIQGIKGFAEWHCHYRPGVDAVFVGCEGQDRVEFFYEKTRPMDFIQELQHIAVALESGAAERSPISMIRGLDTMSVVSAAHRSASTNQVTAVEYLR